jgi:hypothetical protein
MFAILSYRRIPSYLLCNFQQKRELERRLADVEESSVGEMEIRRAKKQLAKVKALYREAQSQLESRQSSSVNKSQLNNLKGQVQ